MSKEPHIRFLLLIIFLVVVWLVTYEWFIKYSWLDHALTWAVAWCSNLLLNALGFESMIYWWEKDVVMEINGTPALLVANICNGLVLYVMFAALVLLFPGPKRHKFWFIPAGIVFIFFMNVIRVISLNVLYVHAPQWLDFNHKYVFNAIVYALIFAAWMVWFRKFSRLSKSKLHI